MDFTFDTKFKKQKIEAIFKKLKLNYNEPIKNVYNIYIKHCNQKRKIRIDIRKSLINVAKYNDYHNGITSYKELEKILKSFSFDIKEKLITNSIF